MCYYLSGGIVFSLYSGLGYTLYLDSETENLEFSQHRYSGFLHAEYRLLDQLSFLIGVQYLSVLLPEVQEFPNYQLYLDIGVIAQLNRQLTLEIAIRENPAPSEGSADVSGLVGLSITF